MTVYRDTKVAASAPWKSQIKLGAVGSRNRLLSAFFHEVGHILDYRNHKFRKYNSGHAPIAYCRKVGIRAERHADLTGSKLMKLHYPKAKYESGYQLAIGKEIILSYYKNPIFTTR